MGNITLQEPYEARPIRCIEIWAVKGWRLKTYGIAYRRDLPRPELIDAAKDLVLRQLPIHSADKNHYGVGFLGIHDGRGSNFVFLGFWVDENELHHHVYVSPSATPADFTYTTPSGLIACVWDLRLMCFERQAWLDSILTNPDGPDLEHYLACQLNGMA